MENVMESSDRFLCAVHGNMNHFFLSMWELNKYLVSLMGQFSDFNINILLLDLSTAL